MTIIYFDYFVLFIILNVKFCETLKALNSCTCKLDDGKVIDLSKLAKKDGTPRFADIPDATGQDFFSYNPCKPFSEGACKDVAVCQTRGSDQYNAGEQKGVSCASDDTGLALVYTSDSPVMVSADNVQRTTVVYLKCDSSKEGDLQAQGEITASTYLMFLSSKYACPHNPGLSAGTILIIVFVSLLFGYFVGGVLYQTFYKKASGKERIPNYTLWSSLPSLVKDGSMFAINKVTGKGNKKGYSSV